jgi:hypothetical protein
MKLERSSDPALRACLAFGVGKGLLCLFARVSLKDVGLSRVSKEDFEGGFEKPD